MLSQLHRLLLELIPGGAATSDLAQILRPARRTRVPPGSEPLRLRMQAVGRDGSEVFVAQFAAAHGCEAVLGATPTHRTDAQRFSTDRGYETGPRLVKVITTHE